MYPLNRFKPFDYKRECDVCGWDYLRSELRETWDGKIVCKYDYEPKHPQLEEKFIPKTRVFKGD